LPKIEISNPDTGEMCRTTAPPIRNKQFGIIIDVHEQELITRSFRSDSMAKSNVTPASEQFGVNIDLHEGTIIMPAFSELGRSFFRTICNSRRRSLYARKNDKKQRDAAQFGVNEKQLWSASSHTFSPSIKSPEAVFQSTPQSSHAPKEHFGLYMHRHATAASVG
jgi:hypothetical protein